MRRIAQVIRLRPEKREEYERLHAEAWPGVLAAIERANIRNYSIWLFEPEHLLFASFEYHGSNYEADMALLAADPETQRWWALTDPCQEPLADRGGDEWWANMREVFRHD